MSFARSEYAARREARRRAEMSAAAPAPVTGLSPQVAAGLSVVVLTVMFYLAIASAAYERLAREEALRQATVAQKRANRMLEVELEKRRAALYDTIEQLPLERLPEGTVTVVVPRAAFTPGRDFPSLNHFDKANCSGAFYALGERISRWLSRDRKPSSFAPADGEPTSSP